MDKIFQASTKDVPKSEKADYWISALGDVWGNIHIEPTNLFKFEGRIHSVKASRLTFNQIKYRGQNIQRTASDIAKMKEDFYVLAFPKGHPWQMNLKGNSFILERGMVFLGSNTVPYKSLDKQGYDTFNVMIPSQLLHNLIPNLELFYLFPLDRKNKKAQILHDFAHSLYDCMPFSGDDEARFMEVHLLNLLAFLIQDERTHLDADDSSVKLAHRRRVLDYIAANLGNELMSPESIAQHHGISASYLHRIFKPHGSTVVEVIREKRLAEAGRMLADPKLAGLSVTEIAYQVGFKHPSDFSRAFKRKYGCSPKEAKGMSLAE